MSIGVCATFVLLTLSQYPPRAMQDAPEADAAVIKEKLERLNSHMERLRKARIGMPQLAEVEICAKAADWITRHHEFFEPTYSQWTIDALDLGLRRAELLATGTSWTPKPGSTVLGYYSRIDGSVQPYAVTIPSNYEANQVRKWPLHVVLHGRNAKLNEVSFIHEFDGQTPKEKVTWIQLDIFGRTNNAYRWAGETDVFEALAALKQRVQIDDKRITLRGFSMGGAGTWHLGLHYPSLWSSIGAGAGFIDTVRYLNLEQLSPLHQKLIKIYDAQEYALNAFDVPTITYAGELDPQLVAAKTMHEKGQELGAPIEILIGPETGHKFHPESLKQFMRFLGAHSVRGRPIFPQPSRLKFITYTLKYNESDWMAIEEQIEPYQATIVDADVDGPTKTVKIHATNVAVLRLRKELADFAVVNDGKPLTLPRSMKGNPASYVYLENRANVWSVLDVSRSERSAAGGTIDGGLRKRKDLQGPVDDAFMQPFICVRPTGTPWSMAQTEWAKWTLERFEHEFDHRLRGRVPVIDDTELTDEMIETKNIVVFGDPGSNAILAKLADKLPVKWSQTQIDVAGRSFPCDDHGLVMIYPNPLNPRKYLVINSGHTFHEAEFVKSNANLYPHLGDISVIHFGPRKESGYDESVPFSELFDAHWRLGEK